MRVETLESRNLLATSFGAGPDMANVLSDTPYPYAGNRNAFSLEDVVAISVDPKPRHQPVDVGPLADGDDTLVISGEIPARLDDDPDNDMEVFII